VAIGFGVSGPEQARELAAHADGIIVGSALVERIDRAAGNPQDAGAGAGPEGDGRASAVVAAAAEFVASLRQAIDPGGRQPAQLLRPSP
ncbi:MAG TPA: tryptophan synthase subunit alpha, partial [Thermaerobacter sp.]